MTAPAQALRCLLWALALGAGLGVVYGFLRPMRPRLTHLADLLFVLAAFYAWLYLSFAICRGQIRLAGTFGLAAGCIAWESTLGRLLRPVFFGFWRPIGKIVKIFRKNAKKLFAFWKKWFTIE